eukprot:3791273-Amphidinium_carterae.1
MGGGDGKHRFPGTWSELGRLNHARAASAAVQVDGELYVAGFPVQEHSAQDCKRCTGTRVTSHWDT